METMPAPTPPPKLTTSPIERLCATSFQKPCVLTVRSVTGTMPRWLTPPIVRSAIVPLRLAFHVPAGSGMERVCARCSAPRRGSVDVVVAGRRYRCHMTEHPPAVVLSHPPVSLLHAANPVVRFLLRTPLAGVLRNQVMVVNVTGRRTGRRYSIPLSAHRIDGDLYALSSAPWKHNFRGGAAAEVLLGGKT